MARTLAAAATAALVATATALPAQSKREREQMQRIVFRAFPEADAYRCIERDVGLEARARIERLLPFKVHFDELGEHTLLVAFRGRRPVGLVYRRTEEADWGLTEVAWHVTLDRRIVGFRYLRGRNRNIKSLERGRFADDLTSADFQDLVKLLARHRGEPRKADLGALERTTLRSAAKTLAVLDTVWRDDIEKLHDRATGFDLFPAAARFTSRTAPVELDRGGVHQTLQTRVLYAYDSGNTFLGCVAWTEGTRDIERHALRWALDRNLRIQSLRPVREHRDVALRKACNQLQGRPLSEPCAESALAPLSRSLGSALPELQRRRARR
ncbi:MAG: hypothetical protein ACE37K_21425 [Planctomycetota bacterium]